VLITGASGFLGSHLVDTFRMRGWRVRALVRARSPRRWLTDASGAPHANVTLVEGDVTAPASLPDAVRGVDVVVHNAGVIDARDEVEYARVNAEGSAHVARAVRDARAAGEGPRRLVYISSLAVAGATRSGTPRCEDDAPAPISAYGRSKLAGECACFDLAGDAEVVSIRPPAIYGPRDVAFLSLVRLIASHVQPVSGPFGRRMRVNVAHVGDVAEAVWLASVQPAAAGRVYFVNDGVMHAFEDVSAAIRDALGTWAVPLPLTPLVLRSVRLVSAAWTALTGRDGLLSGGQAQQLLAGDWIANIERLRRELGFVPRHALRPGWIETIAWYRSAGWLPARA
jgi:nucleoside-diphosphate-sugar epimerase